MIAGAVRESFPDETRVALTPDAAGKLLDHDVDVVLESGAGHDAGFPDSAYEDEGVEILNSRSDVFDQGTRPRRPSRPLRG
ncbi:MAG: hypothetical protein ABEK50_14770 [bacterium]